METAKREPIPEKQYVTKNKLYRAWFKTNKSISDFQTSLGFPGWLVGIYVNRKPDAPLDKPIELITVVNCYEKPLSSDELEKAKQVLEKAKELVDTFPYNGWYLKK